METCTICNTPYPSESLTEFDDELLCHDCLEHETVIAMTAANVFVSKTTPELQIFHSV